MKKGQALQPVLYFFYKAEYPDTYMTPKFSGVRKLSESTAINPNLDSVQTEFPVIHPKFNLGRETLYPFRSACSNSIFDYFLTTI